MDDFLKLVSTFVDAVSLIMALILMLSLLHRNDLSGPGRSVLLGVMFSLAIVFSMSDPIDLGPNGFFDMRGLLVGTAIALMGPVVGLMAATTALSYRYAIGGPGLASGVALIAGAYAGGMLWRVTIKKMAMVNWKKSVILGLFISAQSAGIFFAPPHMQMAILTGLVPYIVISNVIGAVIINHLLSGELSFLSDAARSERDASTDHLTGLLNRRGLDLAYDQQSNPKVRNTESGSGLLYFDLDRFKQVNDTYGHAVGDAVLRHVAGKVSASLRPQDHFARLGGDEFAVVLNNIDERKAEIIAQRCCDVIASEDFNYGGQAFPVSISIGGVWVVDQIEIDRMIEQADKALYAAKTAGRNRVVFNVPEFALAS